jgi:hypothetical protein
MYAVKTGVRSYTTLRNVKGISRSLSGSLGRIVTFGVKKLRHPKFTNMWERYTIRMVTEILGTVSFLGLKYP